MVFFAVAGKYYLCNWLIKFEPGGSFIFYSTLLINWEKCALTNVLSQKHSSISLAYIGKWSNRDVQSPKHLSAACLTGEIRLCWQNEFLFTTGQFPSSNFSKRFNSLSCSLVELCRNAACQSSRGSVFSSFLHLW